MTDYAHNQERPFWVGVDFDGTCVIAGEKYPEIIGDMPGAVAALKEIVQAGGSLLLITSREGEDLKEAVKWFEKHEIPLAGVNENPDPFWAGHRKIYCDVLIDDRTVGFPNTYLSRTYINVADWIKVVEEVLRRMAAFRLDRVKEARKWEVFGSGNTLVP